MEPRTSSTRQVRDLTPEARGFRLRARVLALGPEQSITSRAKGTTSRLVEATVGDASGNVILTLWNDQIGMVQEGDNVLLEDCYVQLVRGRMRVNVGRSGRITTLDEEVEADPRASNRSDEVLSPPPEFTSRRDRPGRY